MYINDSNLQIEIRNMTNTLVMTNVRIQQDIDDEKWLAPLEAIKVEEYWEWDINLLNEIMVFIKAEQLENTFEDETSPQKILMNHVGEFFRLLSKLKDGAKL
jgi:hypothetical protein